MRGTFACDALDAAVVCAKLLRDEGGELELFFAQNRLDPKFDAESFGGYRDALTLVKCKGHICEVQLNLPSLLEAKHRAHEHYAEVRALLPVVCKDAGVDPGELEAFLVQRLSASSADGVVELLADKSRGLFMHARSFL